MNEFSALILKAPALTGAYNAAFMAHYAHPNFCFTKTSFMLEALYEIQESQIEKN
jgi:hypothetical protein